MKKDKVQMSSFYTEILLSFPLFDGKGVITGDAGFIATDFQSKTRMMDTTDSQGDEARKPYLYCELLTFLFTGEFYYKDLINVESSVILTNKSVDNLTPYYDESVEQGEEFEEVQTRNRVTYDRIDFYLLGVTANILHGEIPWYLQKSQYLDIDKTLTFFDMVRCDIGVLGLNELSYKNIYTNVAYYSDKKTKIQVGGGVRYSTDDNSLHGVNADFVYATFRAAATCQIKDTENKSTNTLGFGTGFRVPIGILSFETTLFYNYQPYLDVMPDLKDTWIFSMFLNTLL